MDIATEPEDKTEQKQNRRQANCTLHLYVNVSSYLYINLFTYGQLAAVLTIDNLVSQGPQNKQ